MLFFSPVRATICALLSLVWVTGYSQPSFSQRVVEMPVGYDEARAATYALPNPAVITVKRGIYAEKLVIPSWKRNIRLVGKDRDRVVITHADFLGMEREHADFSDIVTYSTYTSYTVLVQGNDCVLECLKVAITAGSIRRADRCAFINYSLLGHQNGIDLKKKASGITSMIALGIRGFITNMLTVESLPPTLIIILRRGLGRTGRFALQGDERISRFLRYIILVHTPL